MKKLALAAAATLLALGTSSAIASDPQGPEILDTGNFGLYYDPTTLSWSNSPPSLGDIPAADTEVVDFIAEIDGPHGQITGDWLVPFDPSTALQFEIANQTGDTITLSNAGYMLSPTEIPLDDLNFNDSTLPGGFTPLPSLDGPLGAGADSSQVQVAPEPSTFSLIGLTLAACALYHRRLRRA